MAEKLVNDAVNGNPVVMFSKTYCPFCKMAKDSLRQAGLPEKDYVIYELDERGKKGIGCGLLRGWVSLSELHTLM